MASQVYVSIDSAVITGIKSAGATYNAQTKNYSVLGTTFDLERATSGSSSVLTQKTAGKANPKALLEQDAFDAIRMGTPSSPKEPQPHPVFVIGSQRREIVELAANNTFTCRAALSFYDVPAQIVTDIKSAATIYDAPNKGYRIGQTLYTLKRVAAATNYGLSRVTGIAPSERVLLEQEMFDVIRQGQVAIPPVPCNHPVFIVNGVETSLAMLFGNTAPYQGIAMRHQ